MKLIIAGSRTFMGVAAYTSLCKVADQLIKENAKPDEEVVIISGCARGADTLAIQYAQDKGYKLEEYPAKWLEHGKAAGPIRNEEMAKNATHCLVFWDGVSAGTKNMIQNCQKYKIKLAVVKYGITQ